ncbi:tubulin-specific chaperone C-like [Monomorium pharaonis]|uniref:tubulin-specific chaperone C-like n=1 Tax=Monomorium pharaonis TaxID=307658 RepID=UPI001745FE65|nr:tubulin-specific chaperone C-like [Monomorium pharaonis]XP_036144218.1 tubulin-specific chaperone C-like [Monomorium pharaonis]
MYTKLLGPFDTFEDAREIENSTLDISTNDAEMPTEATQMHTDGGKVPQKREIQKSSRFCRSSLSSSPSETKGENLLKVQNIDKEKNQCSINQTVKNETTRSTYCTEEELSEVNSDPLLYGNFFPQDFIQKNNFEKAEDTMIDKDSLCITETKSKASSKPTITSTVVTSIPLPAGIFSNNVNDNDQLSNNENNIQRF